MKEKLIEMLIEAQAKRGYYESKWDNAFFSREYWKALWVQENERIGAIKEQLQNYE